MYVVKSMFYWVTAYYRYPVIHTDTKLVFTLSQNNEKSWDNQQTQDIELMLLQCRSTVKETVLNASCLSDKLFTYIYIHYNQSNK